MSMFFPAGTEVSIRAILLPSRNGFNSTKKAGELGTLISMGP